MTEIEIRTATDSTEPTLTLSQWHLLMTDAAALERASRPIVLTGPEDGFVSPLGAPVAVTVPMSPARPVTAPSGRRTFTLPEVIGYCGATTTGTSGAAGIALLLFNSPAVCGLAALAGLFVSLGAAIAANRDDDRRLSHR